VTHSRRWCDLFTSQVEDLPAAGLSPKSVDKSVVKGSHFALTHCPLWSFIKLIKNWPALFQQHAKPPETVDEAVDQLVVILDGEQKAAIAVMREEDLIDLHFSLGMAIRNAFGLHTPDSKLKVSFGPHIQADDISVEIINKLWSRLKYAD
jgi:hypothetical protein